MRNRVPASQLHQGRHSKLRCRMRVGCYGLLPTVLGWHPMPSSVHAYRAGWIAVVDVRAISVSPFHATLLI